LTKFRPLLSGLTIVQVAIIVRDLGEPPTSLGEPLRRI
jgi:hypothetical protein